MEEGREGGRKTTTDLIGGEGRGRGAEGGDQQP
jgi:hypothetical protein